MGSLSLTIATDHFLGETGEINKLVIVRVDIEILNPRSKMIHKLTQGSGRDGPVVYGLFTIELGTDGRDSLVG